MRLFSGIQTWERRLRAHFNCDLSTPENQRKNRIYRLFFDHEILRGIWTNFHEIAPGVFRSNHPTRKRFAQMKARGITTVLNLRGANLNAHYWAEEAWCRELGLDLVSVEMQARALVTRARLQELIATFRTLPRPFVMHCKSGADRAGMASAVYLLVIEQRPIAEAKKMLAPRYFHIRNRHVGILDYALESYEAHIKHAPMDFETWVDTVYDPQILTERFRDRRPAQ